MLFSTVTGLLASVLASILPNYPSSSTPQSPPPPAPLQFELRHFHAVSSDARVLFQDVPPRLATTSNVEPPPSHSLRTRRTKVYRPASQADFERARTMSARFAQSMRIDWDEDEREGPDTEDRQTLLQLAKMTNNAYLEPGEQGWYDLGEKWNVSYPFGWETDSSGFRGHVFATPDNSTVVLAIKGTSAAFIGGGGPTAKKDKLNDNLLFSCCCARVDWTWTTVCGCYKGGWKCDLSCLEDSLIADSLFYPIGTNLYNNLTYLYPSSNIWMVGHSLGGALASLLGVTFGTPVVAIESPGEKMAAGRLHLPSPPEVQHVTHLYHTADPIAMGTCNGVLSSCALGGYAMESKCHLGRSMVFDTVSELGWAADIRTHTIVNVIEKLLASPWPPSMKDGREVPQAVPEEDCVECYSWDYGDY